MGLIGTKRKEQSAEKIREEFGLSDKAMEVLSAVKSRKINLRGEISSEVINFILENVDFWRRLNRCLPAYLACLYDARTTEFEQEQARYSVIRTFEQLVDEISETDIMKKFPIGELDKTDVFCSLK